MVQTLINTPCPELVQRVITGHLTIPRSTTFIHIDDIARGRRNARTIPSVLRKPKRHHLSAITIPTVKRAGHLYTSRSTIKAHRAGGVRSTTLASTGPRAKRGAALPHPACQRANVNRPVGYPPREHHRAIVPPARHPLGTWQAPIRSQHKRCGGAHMLIPSRAGNTGSSAARQPPSRRVERHRPQRDAPHGRSG